MRTLKNIDVEKSIATKKLHYKKSWDVYLDQLFFYVSFTVGFVFFPILNIVFELDDSNPTEKVLKWIFLPAVICFGVYMTFRKLTELHLRNISTHLSQVENQQRVLEFARKNEYKIRRKYGNCIVLDRSGMNSNFGKTAVVFVLDQSLYFTMIQDTPRINLPTLFSHLLFGLRLKK